VIIKELLLKLGLDIDSASFAEGHAVGEALEKGLEKVVDWAIEATEKFKELFVQTGELAHELEVMAQETGLSTDALQELQFAANMTGVGTDQLNTNIFFLSRSMDAARRGSEQQAAAFAKLHVKVTGANGKLRDTDEVLMDLADRFADLPDGLEKTHLAMEVFGRSGARVIPLLNKGADGLREIREEAVKLTDEQIEAGVEFTLLQKQIQAYMEGTWHQVAADVLPIFNQILKRTLEWWRLNQQLVRQRLTQVIRGIATAISYLSSVVKFLADNVEALTGILIGAAAAWALVNVAAVKAAIATTAAWLVAAAPFIVIAGVLTALLLFLDDIKRFREGRESLLGLWAQTIEEWQKPNDKDPWWLAAIKELVIWMEKALGIADKLGVAGDKASKRGEKQRQSAGEARDPMTGAAIPAPFIASNVDLDEEERKNPNSYNAKFNRAWKATGSEYEGVKAGLGFGPYGKDIIAPSAAVASAAVPQEMASYPNQSRSVVVNQSNTVNISAPGAVANDLIPIIDDRFEKLQDGVHEDTLAAVSR
jgi:hypothetical protein